MLEETEGFRFQVSAEILRFCGSLFNLAGGLAET